MAGVDHSVHTFDVKRSCPRKLTFYLNAGKRWTPSLMTFGAFSGIMFLYFTDWQIFMDKIPIYNKKFEEKEPLV